MTIVPGMESSNFMDDDHMAWSLDQRRIAYLEGEAMPATAAATIDRGLEIALLLLLHNLKPFMRADPYDGAASMPDHYITLVDGVGDSVGKAVAEVVKAYPAIWLQTLPKDLCVVSRSSLARVVAAYPYVAEHLEQDGMARVYSEAARLRNEIEFERR